MKCERKREDGKDIRKEEEIRRDKRRDQEQQVSQTRRRRRGVFQFPQMTLVVSGEHSAEGGRGVKTEGDL